MLRTTHASQVNNRIVFSFQVKSTSSQARPPPNTSPITTTRTRSSGAPPVSSTPNTRLVSPKSTRTSPKETYKLPIYHSICNRVYPNTGSPRNHPPILRINSICKVPGRHLSVPLYQRSPTVPIIPICSPIRTTGIILVRLKRFWGRLLYRIRPIFRRTITTFLIASI